MTAPIAQLKLQIADRQSKGLDTALLEARLAELNKLADIADAKLKAKQALERLHRGL